ncbi:SAM-dependent methyltransferase [Methylocystis bryophila]|uniref:SAM-dependent methyltransferase n=1 Tax=Methylocystis bryophila TaxID=655015 RepID=A0A1W6N1G1_9HYPH|nr:class I SAM-dependent methyltransferase [Methylocystis bryophila]ARN83673.1 SAM-dependent methyltransferase [Methylocystis bryophila]
MLRQEVDADFLARRSAARARLDGLAKPGRDPADSTGAEWFRYVYAAAGEDPAQVPWARLAPHPLLAAWLASNDSLTGLRALDVACGLGDNAEALAAAGAETTAFDYAERAIAWARQRFPESAVRYAVADLFDLPPEWEGAFDLVHECATLQTFTPEQLPSAAAALARLVAPRGRLLVITAAREEEEPQTTPWRPLSRQEIEGLAVDGLGLETLHDIPATSPSGARLWRALLRRRE